MSTFVQEKSLHSETCGDDARALTNVLTNRGIVEFTQPNASKEST